VSSWPNTTSAQAVAIARRYGCGDVYGATYGSVQTTSGGGVWQDSPIVDRNLHANCIPPQPDPPYCEFYTWDYDMESWPCNSPIIIATGKNQANRLTSPEDGVNFDFNGDGVVERAAWTMAGDDIAFLAIDKNGNGLIDSGRELFGNLTAPGAENGFAALQTLNLALNGNVRVGMIDCCRLRAPAPEPRAKVSSSPRTQEAPRRGTWLRHEFPVCRGALPCRSCCTASSRSRLRNSSMLPRRHFRTA
jgi:hypothetical protein